MKTAKLLILLLCSLTADAAVERLSRGLWGPQRAFRGYSIWVLVTTKFFDAFPASFNTSTERITAVGNNFAVNDTIYFIPSSGGSLPSTLGLSVPYTLCDKSGDSFRVVVSGVGSCTDTTFYVQFVDGGSGTVKVARMINSEVQHVYLTSSSLPAGVTIGEISCNGRTVCFQSAGTPYSYGGLSEFWVRLDVSPSAPLGTGTIQFNLRCNNSACPDASLSAPLTIRDLVPVAINHPTSFPPIPNKSNWESTMLQLAAKWCDQSTGTINPSPLSALSFGSTGENQVWYYDGSWVFYQIADYTGNPNWRRCSNTILDFYRTTILGLNGSFSQYYRWFSDGLRRSCGACDRRGKVAIDRVWENNVTSQTAGYVQDYYLRETSYAMEAALAAARARGFHRFSEINDATLKTRVQRTADQLLGLILSTAEPNYMSFQSFMGGLAMRAAIEWYEFSGDLRVPVEVKELIDLMNAEMWNKNPAFPNEMSYMRGSAVPGAGDLGPKCPYKCFPYPAKELHPLFSPAWAWLWWMTGNQSYQTIGDAMWTAGLSYDISYSGKIFSQNYRWSFDYVAWREGKKPNRP